jgi:hypothetical protein
MGNVMWFLFFPLIALAQEDIDLSEVRKLEENLPTMEHIDSQSEVIQRLSESKHRPPGRPIPLKEIKNSGTLYGAIPEGVTLTNFETGQHQVTTKHFFVKYYRLEDEFGYKYLLNEDGACLYKVKSDDVADIKEETALYVPPLRYTPAPVNMMKREFDKKLEFNPQFSFYAGFVNSRYMRDLFDDKEANTGISTQYGLHLSTDWDLPVNTGLVLHYEKANYNLAGGSASYTALSFGPQFFTREFNLFSEIWRLQTQFRISPFARVEAQSSAGSRSFKFNSADLLISLDHPINNAWGEFLVSPFVQIQWLNLKNQTEPVSVKASNETNNTFGIALSQVFE